MSNLEIKKEDALKAYEETNKEGKKLLRNLLGEEVFINPFEAIQNHMEDFKEACKRLNISSDLPALPSMSKSVQAHHTASHMLMVFIADEKAGKKAKYGDAMYYPWWYRSEHPSGFRLHCVSYDYSNTSVGAPFEFFSKDSAQKIVEKYKDLYQIKMAEIEF